MFIQIQAGQHLRLSDIAVQSVDNAEVEKIILEVSNQTISDEEKLRGLVYSGVALGADEVAVYNVELTPQLAKVLKECLDTVDAALDESTGPAMSEILAKVRKPLAEKLSEYTKVAISTYVDAYSSIYGYDEGILRSTEPLNLSDEEMVRMGTEVFRRSELPLLGWYLADSAGTLSTMKCSCPTCVARNFGEFKVTEEMALRQVMAAFGGFDKAAKAYVAYAIPALRKKIEERSVGSDNLHDIDTKAASDFTSQALARVMGKGDGQ